MGAQHSPIAVIIWSMPVRPERKVQKKDMSCNKELNVECMRAGQAGGRSRARGCRATGRCGRAMTRAWPSSTPSTPAARTCSASCLSWLLRPCVATGTQPFSQSKRPYVCTGCTERCQVCWNVHATSGGLKVAISFASKGTVCMPCLSMNIKVAHLCHCSFLCTGSDFCPQCSFACRNVCADLRVLWCSSSLHCVDTTFFGRA